MAQIVRCQLLWLTSLALAPMLGAQATPPYGPSPVIRGATWDFAHLIRLAYTAGKGGSDLWPTTWAADGEVYTGWGDGGGFEGAGDATGRVSLGFARLTGWPPQVTGANVWGHFPKYAPHPATFCGKPISMLSVNGTLYAWISSWYNESGSNYVHCAPNPNPVEHRLAWSSDLGATWTLSPWKVDRPPLNWITFLNFGKDNGGARDRYVYQYWRMRGKDGFTYLVRVLPTHLKESPETAGIYEYYAGPGPRWTAELSDARPVFVDRTLRAITHVIYDSPLQRYLASVQGRGVGASAVFDAPEPWGPWTTVASYQNWGGFGSRESLGVDFPTKWISPQGTSLWAVFSGGRLAKNDDALDSFNLVRLTLLLRKPAAGQGTGSASNQVRSSLPRR